MKGNLLSKETREKVVSAVLERMDMPVKFRNKNMSISEIINYQARHLADCIKDDKTYKPFIPKW